VIELIHGMQYLFFLDLIRSEYYGWYVGAFDKSTQRLGGWTLDVIDTSRIVPLDLAMRALELQAENERLRALVGDMANHLQFAEIRGDEFAFHDPDMVIDNWLLGAHNLIEAAEVVLEGDE